MALSGVTLAAVAVQFVLFLMEAWEKRAFALEQRKGDSPEIFAGLINRLFF